MIHSMTGYGTAQSAGEGWVVSVEARSVNHRMLDLHVHSPRVWPWLERHSLKYAKSQLQRGRVDIRIDVQRDASESLPSVIDPERFAAVANELKAAAEANGLGAVKMSDVLAFSQVRARSNDQEDELPEDEWVFGVIESAIQELLGNRIQEGERLGEEMLALLEGVKDEICTIEAILASELDEYRDRLKTRVDEAIVRFGIEEVDPLRVIQEVVIYADRAAIAEEIQRAHSHIIQLHALISDDRDDVRGKQTDFYLQEMMREANTMGSKTGSTAVTDAVVRIKSAIGKLREQAANIE